MCTYVQILELRAPIWDHWLTLCINFSAMSAASQILFAFALITNVISEKLYLVLDGQQKTRKTKNSSRKWSCITTSNIDFYFQVNEFCYTYHQVLH